MTFGPDAQSTADYRHSSRGLESGQLTDRPRAMFDQAATSWTRGAWNEHGITESFATSVSYYWRLAAALIIWIGTLIAAKSQTNWIG